MMSPTDPLDPARLRDEAEAEERDTRLIWAGFFFALAIYAQAPAIDLMFSARYYVAGQGFIHAHDPMVRWMYLWTPWLGRALLVGMAVVALWGPQMGAALVRRGRVAWGQSLAGGGRRVAILAVCAALIGPGLVIEGLFKNTVGRPRPVQVTAFGGDSTFQGPLAIGNDPGSHKSFCSSHAATGFALMGLGLGCGPLWRRRWFLIGLVTGSVVGMGRILQGGHFLSDIIFAFYAVWLSCELVLWLEQRRTMRNAPPRSRPHRPIRPPE